MAIEEIRYDFREHMDHFKPFFAKTLRLIIISKLNCLGSNKTSIKYFNEIVNRIEGCRTHTVKYGKTVTFVEYLNYKFNYQTVKVSIKFIENYIIDIILESIFSEFIMIFDRFSSSESSSIKWNIDKNIETNPNKDNQDLNNGDKRKDDTIQQKKKRNKNRDTTENEGQEKDDGGMLTDIQIQKDIAIIFNLLDSFIESIFFLASSSSSPSSSDHSINNNQDINLKEKTIEIRDVSVVRKTINIEFLVDEKTTIISLTPKKRNPVIIALDNESKTGHALKDIMLQYKNI
ncbi:MAG: hypothetical protein M3162_05070 [Thermoproteota archaeon]|nr:hypothetical protein [Thermoproteota archaeon]